MIGVVCVVVASVAVLFVSLEWEVEFGTVLTPETKIRLFSSDELSLFDGQEGSMGLYLAILGQVFDVHQGHKHYGPGGAYHFMTGDFYCLILLKLYQSVCPSPPP